MGHFSEHSSFKVLMTTFTSSSLQISSNTLQVTSINYEIKVGNYYLC
jgi:hypothetical protein